MNMHLESTNEMVTYHQQMIARDYAAVQTSMFWHDMRIWTAHALIRIGQALDDRCRDHTPDMPINTTRSVAYR